MNFRGMADSGQLAALTRLLNEYSKVAGIEGDEPARDHLAARIMSLFNDGITRPEDIMRRLDSSPGRRTSTQPVP